MFEIKVNKDLMMDTCTSGIRSFVGKFPISKTPDHKNDEEKNKKKKNNMQMSKGKNVVKIKKFLFN